MNDLLYMVIWQCKSKSHPDLIKNGYPKIQHENVCEVFTNLDEAKKQYNNLIKDAEKLLKDKDRYEPVISVEVFITISNGCIYRYRGDRKSDGG